VTYVPNIESHMSKQHPLSVDVATNYFGGFDFIFKWWD